MGPASAARLRLIAIRIVDHPAGTEPVMVARIVVTVPVTAARAQPRLHRDHSAVIALVTLDMERTAVLVTVTAACAQPRPHRGHTAVITLVTPDMERTAVVVLVTAACAQPRHLREDIAVTTTAILERIALIAPLIAAVVTTMGTELAVTIIALVSPIQDRPTQIATVTETPVNVTL